VTVLDVATANLWVDVASLIATVVGLGVAVFAIVHQISALRREQNERAEEERERDRERRRGQAECVTARLKLEPDQMSLTIGGDRPTHTRYYAQVEVFNASQLPISSIEIFSPDIDHPGMVYPSSIEGILPGGQSDHRHLPPQSNNDLDGHAATVHFTDAAGVRWHKHESGELHEWDECPAALVDDEQGE